MEIQINAVYNVIPLLVRYKKDNETFEVLVHFNMETNRLTHSLDFPPEIMAEFENKVVEVYDPSLPNPEHMVRFDDFMTPELQAQINGARQGDPKKLEGLSTFEDFDFNKREQ